MTLNRVTLDDKYDLSKSRIFVTGFQALVRLCLMQKERDRRAGLHTAGYVTGYRGSPLGTLDQQFIRARAHLDRHDVRFQPGINEDLAATALWGTQQAELRGEGKFDGVFSIWYGKGPGVDRTGDVFRHANFAGTSHNGGVLALMGDDHTAESSTTAHQSEFHFVDVMIPILNPAGVQEFLDYGLYGWAMSRYCGSWVALKCMHEKVESTAVDDGSLERVKIVLPEDGLDLGGRTFRMPEGGLNIRLNDTVLGMEARLHDYKRDAMLAFLRANKLNRYITSGGRNPKIGIITVGKSYLDVRQAFDELSIDEAKCSEFGIRLYKVACPWPLSQRELKEFSDGLDLIIVVEEKRSLLEVQVREELYGTANQPACIGKKDEQGNWLFPVKGALDPNDIAICIGERILARGHNDLIAAEVARLKQAQRALAEIHDVAQRTPYFCSGCPHNTSTVVPDGMRAYAGIGCHYMVQWMDRRTSGFTQMGAEGANWIGEAPFSKRGHVFQNLGDGTYNHSGYLAIRAAVAAGVIINELVCEGCGDCGVVSNCVSVQPLETEFGRKRTIDQTSCNKDFSCLKGFCPSFVTVHGAKLERNAGTRRTPDEAIPALPEPLLPPIDGTYDIIITGIGGTGIVTIGGVLGMAAHLEGKGVGVIDMAGLAQKGGAVYSHMRIARQPEDIHAIRVAAASAELVLGGDIVVAGTKKVLAAAKPGRTDMVVNVAEFLPGEFTRNVDFSLPTERLRRAIAAAAGPDKCRFVDATRIAT